MGSLSLWPRLRNQFGLLIIVLFVFWEVHVHVVFVNYEEELTDGRNTVLRQRHSTHRKNATSESPRRPAVVSIRSPQRSQTHPYDASGYQRLLNEAKEPFANVSTAAYLLRSFYSGYRNQGMVFTAFVMTTMENNHSQILLPSIKWKDQFGTDRRIPHAQLFDVVHWNSFYPQLPRMVDCDPGIHPHYNCKTDNWRIGKPLEHATKPYALAETQTQMWNKYKRYTKQLGNNPRNPAELLMLRGAFRPHPGIQHLINRHLKSMNQDGGGSNEYMALHARIEPDMQNHPVCADRKVVALKAILRMIQEKFPEPPAQNLLIVTGRRLLEKEVNDPKSENRLAVENLNVLNETIKKGLWDGRVKAFEAGEMALGHTKYAQNMRSIAGSIVNYFLSIDAKVFIGNEVSSYSTDIQTTRFFRGNMENYMYLPEGLKLTTKANAKNPPRFVC